MFPTGHDGSPLAAARRRARWLVRFGLAAVLVVLAYRGFWFFHLKRFAAVKPGVLYRSGQPTAWGLQYLVRRYGVRTVVSLRGRSRDALRRGMTDVGAPDGPAEAQFVESLGCRYLHWPMGQESYWPWLPPAHFERFFQLMDDPRNHPVAVHCIAGRHRTGTFVALYRLEYDRWSPEAALLEMQRFGFGHPVLIQEHNLRTYWPRPRPDQETFAQLKRDWASLLPPAEEDYQRWVWRLRQQIHQSGFQQYLRKWIRRRGGFSLCVALRLIDRVDEPTQQAITAEALRVLQSSRALADCWGSAAALVADYGTRQQQQWLLEWLQRQVAQGGSAGPKYHAVFQGVTNRYRLNRFPYWNALLADRRRRREPQCRQYRYGDTAAARMFCTIPQRLAPYVESWEQVHRLVRHWVHEHPEVLQLRRVSAAPVHQATRPQRQEAAR